MNPAPRARLLAAFPRPLDTVATATPPSPVTCWFTRPDGYRLPSPQLTDVSFNDAFLIPLAGREMQIFVGPRVTSVFSRMGVASDDDSLQTFNPFTEKPVEGVHHTFEPGPVSRLAHQNPRTCHVSFGVRFEPTASPFEPQAPHPEGGRLALCTARRQDLVGRRWPPGHTPRPPARRGG